MRGYAVVAVVLLTLGASACRKAPAAGADAVQDPSGRAGQNGYVAVGIYTPGAPWRRLVAGSAQTSANTALARTADDQAVIVVQNSLTGDIRACGDLTGYCVGTNPWVRRPGQLTPVSLTDHQPTEAEQAAKQQADDAEAAKKQAAVMAALKRSRAAAWRRHHPYRG